MKFTIYKTEDDVYNNQVHKKLVSFSNNWEFYKCWLKMWNEYEMRCEVMDWKLANDKDNFEGNWENKSNIIM